MAIPPLPLNKPHADKAAGLPEPAGSAPAEEIERRVQEILLEWLQLFFTAVPFETPGEGTKTFEACDLKWGETTPELPASKPIVHIYVADRRDEDPIRIPPALWETRGAWVFTVLVKTNARLPAGGSGADLPDSAEKQSVRTCRKVADQFHWLLKSPHTQSLSLKGVRRVRVQSSPKLIPSGAYHARILTFSADITTRTPRNDP